jgi:hypothetical protein
MDALSHHPSLHTAGIKLNHRKIQVESRTTAVMFMVVICIMNVIHSFDGKRHIPPAHYRLIRV